MAAGVLATLAAETSDFYGTNGPLLTTAQYHGSALLPDMSESVRGSQVPPFNLANFAIVMVAVVSLIVEMSYLDRRINILKGLFSWLHRQGVAAVLHSCII